MSGTDRLLLALPLFFAAAFGVAAIYVVWVESRLRSGGVQAKGRVLELRSDSRFGLTYAFMEYSYRVEGQEYMARQSITSTHYEHLVEGVAVDIAYLAATPSVARLAGDDFDS